MTLIFLCIFLFLLKDGTDELSSSSPERKIDEEETTEVPLNDEKEDTNPEDNQLQKVEIATTPSTEVVSVDNCLIVSNL